MRTVTTDTGALEDRYEYDTFGTPYEGDFSGGMNLGYTGKPYDSSTGLYDYGFRDYMPQAARFTTSDPIRDGNNWFAYVNNDPVNYIDLWGLDMMFSTYVRDSGKIVSVYIPTKSDGSIDSRNVRTYEFSATNDVISTPTETILANGAYGEYYYPQTFPTGTWDVKESRLVLDGEKNKSALGDVYINTNAHQIVDTYGTTKPTPGDLPSSTQDDYFYGLHFSNNPTTAGCIRFGSQEEANGFAALSDQALNSNGGKSILSVKKNK